MKIIIEDQADITYDLRLFLQNKANRPLKTRKVYVKNNKYEILDSLTFESCNL